MNIILHTSIVLTALSFIFAGQVEAKHGSEQARSRVLKEITRVAHS